MPCFNPNFQNFWCGVILLVVTQRKNPRFEKLSASRFDPAYYERFETLYKKFGTPLLKFIAKRIGTRPEATEEVFAETMVAAWKGYKTFRHKSSYFTWLCRISLNKIADYWRDQINENSHVVIPTIEKLLAIPTEETSAEERLALIELKKSVNDALNLLPYKTRRLLWYRYWRDLSIREIAKILGVSERAVEGKLYRARHGFAKAWRENA